MITMGKPAVAIELTAPERNEFEREQQRKVTATKPANNGNR
jgi:hypothetical protein